MDLRTALQKLADPQFAAWQTNYLRNQFPFLGVKTPAVRAAVKPLLPIENWRAAIQKFWNEQEREFHHAALFIAIGMRKEAVLQDLDLYQQLICTHSWWDTVDTIAPHLVAPLLIRFPSLVTTVESWLESPHLWLKRAALIYPLHQRKKMDSKRLFYSCERLSRDPDFFIRKAIGWVLREHSKTHPQQVRQFLKTAALSPLSLREATKYLEIAATEAATPSAVPQVCSSNPDFFEYS